ncbi:MAG TPA: hypothetical protein VN836_04095 [Verrucomicrobiae bacterium]|nr:hypothetical protein [Verrucomicrobiae bacterium]
MKPEDFEQRLQRQPRRQIPAGWRAEILAAANPAPRSASRAPFLSTINSQLSTLLWPHPKAWAGLAAVWVFIFVLNFSMRDKAPALVEKVSPPSPEVVAELKQQQRILAELMGARDALDADRSRPMAPRPRSERPFEVLTV